MAESLKNIKAKLIEAYKLYPFQLEPNTFTIASLVRLRKFVNILQSVNLFTSQVDILARSIIFTTTADTIKSQQTEFHQINNALHELKQLIFNFNLVLETVVPADNLDSVNITLPSYVDDFDDLSEVSHTLHTVLTQVLLNDEIGGETKIMSVENGSIKINVKVGTKGVVLIAGLAWAAAVVYKKTEEAMVLAAQVESLQINNFTMKDMQEAQKKQIDLLIETEADMIHKEHFTKEDAEKTERLKYAIRTFAELISKGAEFSPALQAPEDVSNLFPNFKNLVGVESRTKHIAAPEAN